MKVQYQHVNGASPAWTHQFFRYAGSPPLAADAASAANTIKSYWSSSFAQLAGIAWSLVQVVVTDLNSPTGGQGVSGAGSVAGTRAGGQLTANDCVLMNQHIQRRYRGGKPRQYWPFGVESDIASAVSWSTTFTSLVQSQYNAFVTAVNAITWTGGNISGPVNVSYFTLPNKVVISPTTGRARNVPTLRSTPLIDAIISSSVNSRIATQRRRQHFSA